MISLLYIRTGIPILVAGNHFGIMLKMRKASASCSLLPALDLASIFEMYLLYLFPH